VADVTEPDGARNRQIRVMDSNRDYRIRIAVILDVVILVGFFAVIGIMAARAR
jgi:hypothetical protein